MSASQKSLCGAPMPGTSKPAALGQLPSCPKPPSIRTQTAVLSTLLPSSRNTWNQAGRQIRQGTVDEHYRSVRLPADTTIPRIGSGVRLSFRCRQHVEWHDWSLSCRSKPQYERSGSLHRPFSQSMELLALTHGLEASSVGTWHLREELCL